MQQVQKDPKGLPQPTDKELKLINQEFNVFLDEMGINLEEGLDSGTDAPLCFKKPHQIYFFKFH